MRLKRTTKKLISKSRLIKSFLTITITNIIFFILYIKVINYRNPDFTPYYNVEYYNQHSTSLFYKIDWHDWKAIMAELTKNVRGSRGARAHLPPNEWLTGKEYQNQIANTGYNARLSDRISFTRSVPDIRNKACKTKHYLSDLPNVSVIIIFWNEHWSILLRTVHSVINRSPANLIYEIILVDDFSDKDFLVHKLDNYIEQNFPKVKLIRLKQRSGLIVARLTGAKAAKGEVLIFLDSNVETNYNWLPPLLEPIAYNPKIVLSPLIDSIDYQTFAYTASEEGGRTAFDWKFHYKRLPMLPETIPSKPYPSPVMAGGIFAINRKWFWELGGYDPGLDIWGGEEFELSFKIWMCGGEMLEVPCSRVGYVYRGAWRYKNPRTTDYVHRNYKRVAEVWMDEYAKFLYDRDLPAFNAVDSGDISSRKEIRQRLKCKSFKWYMENIAYDTLIYYPPVEPPSYAYSVRSMADKKLCLDTLSHGNGEEPGLTQCTKESLHGKAEGNQNWEISWHKDLKLRGTELCLDAPDHYKNARIKLYQCQNQQGNQCWFYDHSKKLLVQGVTGYCLEANIKYHTVYINQCNETNINMKWDFSFYNVTGLKGFYTHWPEP